jgi:ethanolamine utilization microcompartment shell protein EutS
MTAAKKLARRETYIETGTVERAGEPLGVLLPSGLYEARRAKSCLCAPEVGDTVLCAVTEPHTFVLAVLEGREGAATRVVADGDLELSARHGRVTVAGREGVDVVTPGEVAMTAGELHLRAQRGSAAIDELGFFGRVLQAEVRKIATVAHEIDSVVERLTLRAKRVFRFVEETDQTRAGSVDLRAQNLVGIRGENAIISARTLAKLDGEQVNIG